MGFSYSTIHRPPPLSQFSPETVDSGINETRGPLGLVTPAAIVIADKLVASRVEIQTTYIFVVPCPKVIASLSLACLLRIMLRDFSIRRYTDPSAILTLPPHRAPLNLTYSNQSKNSMAFFFPSRIVDESLFVSTFGAK